VGFYVSGNSRKLLVGVHGPQVPRDLMLIITGIDQQYLRDTDQDYCDSTRLHRFRSADPDAVCDDLVSWLHLGAIEGHLYQDSL